MTKKVKLQSGDAVTLTTSDMVQISKLYHIECIKEYLYENKEDWTDEKVDFVAKRAFDIFDDIERGEEEDDSICQAEDEWNERTKN